MGLVARRAFTGDGGRQYAPGDPCDEALGWRYPALRACLNNGIIEDMDGTVKRHFAPRRQTFIRRAHVPAPQAPVVELVAVPAAPGPDDEVEPDADLGDAEVDKAPAGAALAEAGAFRCACGRCFLSERALKIHKARASCA